MPGLSRPSMASEALGLLPGEMQEQFPAGALMARHPETKDMWVGNQFAARAAGFEA